MSTDESTATNKKSLLRKVLFKLLFWRKAKEPTIRDTIEELIEEDEVSETKSIAEDEREMLGNVLNLRDVQVQDR